MKENYQRILDNTLNNLKQIDKKPRLFLHCCCAPCSSYVMEYLSGYFDITVYFYNPNITESKEYNKRADELIRLIYEMGLSNSVTFLHGEYEPEAFTEIAKGLENEPEGGARCHKCYNLRLEKTAQKAAENGFDYFTTTLSISPHKDAQILNKIGKELAEKYGIGYLFSDFKKRNGYKRSCELSKIYNLYRQDYCGCIYSKLNNQKKMPI